MPYTIFEHEEDIATSNTIKKRKFLVVKIHLLSAAMDIRGPGYKIELDRSNNSLIISTQLFNSQKLFWGEDGAKLFEAVIPNVPGMMKSMLVHNHSITLGHITLNHTLYPKQVMVIKLPRKVRSLHDNIPLSITYIAKDNPERIDDNFSCLTVCIEQDWVDHDRPSEKEFAFIRSPPLHSSTTGSTAVPPAGRRFASSTSNANFHPSRHHVFNHGHSSHPFNMDHHQQQGHFQGSSGQVRDSLGSGVSEASSSQQDEHMNSQQRSDGSSASRSARFNAQAHSFEQHYNNIEAGAQRRSMQTEQEILNRYQSFEASQFAELQRMREYLRQELQEDILNSILNSGRGRMPTSVPHHQYSNAGDNNGAFNTTTYPPTGVGSGASEPHRPEESQHHVDSRLVSVEDHDGQQQDYPADVESLSDSFSHLGSSNNL